MPRRDIDFVNGSFFHIYNRGVAKMSTFSSTEDYKQALLGLSYYCFINPRIKLSQYKRLSTLEKSKKIMSRNPKTEKLVKIISFVLMPNHFHLILEQITDDGISKFVSKFTNSYTRYYNTKHSRVGPLFQGQFKAIQIESGEQLVHLTRYIHLNPYVSDLVSKDRLEDYKWSSFSGYLNGENDFISTDIVLGQFNSKNSFRDFVYDHANYARELEIIKHSLHD